MLRVESKIVEHGIVLVDPFLEFDKVGQVVGNLWVSGDDMSSDKLCCLEWLAADGASTLFGVIHTNVRLDDAFVRRVAVGRRAMDQYTSHQSRFHSPTHSSFCLAP